MAKRFVADLHIHSHFSRATSRELTPERLDFWGRLKGVTLVGSGDFTHPGWLAELDEKLEPAEPGLLRLKDAYLRRQRLPFPWAEGNPVRFMFSGEISTIYKRAGRVRKVHSLILAPDRATVEKINQRLIRLEANLTSDGRPIIGLDCRDLLELVLEASAGMALFIPAHIWTPWFSLLGDKSGFDSLDECYGDLAGQIHAVETGLSSDPPMNWLCPFLDRLSLVSNSDAHSPERLGREANLFTGDLSFATVVESLKNGDPKKFLGTLEFFPEEGKYHFDGHRRCGVGLHPDESVRNDGLCPVCGKKLTVGVLHRVRQLAAAGGRRDGQERPRRLPFHSMIPLREILAEILGVTPACGRVEENYLAVLKKLGPEIPLLLEKSLADIRSAAGDELAEAVRRMRSGEVFLEPGYDGEYGRVRVFAKSETASLLKQKQLFSRPEPARSSEPEQIRGRLAAGPVLKKTVTTDEIKPPSVAMTIDDDQAAAIRHRGGPALVIAGPGTGKTEVLARRVASLVLEDRIEPSAILAVTFTNKAAGEMRQRIDQLLKGEAGAAGPRVTTFHRFGLDLLGRCPEPLGRRAGFVVLGEEDRLELIRPLAPKGIRVAELAEYITRRKQSVSGDRGPDTRFNEAFDRYQETLAGLNLFDLDDLIQQAGRLLELEPRMAASWREAYPHILVDECQDINPAQYRLVTLLAKPPDADLMMIGDPDQAIYGFRGADPKLIGRFLADYQPTVFRLRRSFRCAQTVLDASSQVLLRGGAAEKSLTGPRPGLKLRLVSCASGRSEAEFIARSIEAMLGGTGFFSMDSQVADGEGESGITGLADFAVLCRLGEQLTDIATALSRHNIPCQRVAEEPFFCRQPLRTLLDLLRLAKLPDHDILRQRLLKSELLRGGDRGDACVPAVPAVHDLDGLLALLSGQPDVKIKLTRLAEKLLPHSTAAEAFAFESLLTLAAPWGDDVDGFLTRLLLGDAIDGFHPGLEAVALLTIHAAKGLEFPCVFIPGCEEGMLPYALFAKHTADREEEQRLLYVAMTRARDFLFLSHARRRVLFGKTWKLARSRFLDPIEHDLLELSGAGPGRGSKASGEAKQRKLFKL